MGLLNRNKAKPEPGVPKDAPRKKGIGRFFELLHRHLGDLVKLNLLYQLCLLPAQALFLAALLAFFFFGSALWFMVFGLLAMAASCVVGAAHSALYHGLTRLLRGEPGFVGHDFKRIFLESFRPMLGLGIFYAVILGAQIFAYLYFTSLPFQLNILFIIVFILSMLLFALVFPFVFLQGAYVELGAGTMFKNGLFMALGFLPRSLCGALVANVLLVLQFSQFPWLVPVTALIGYAIPALIQMMWVWPPFDETFQIDSILRARAAQESKKDD